VNAVVLLNEQSGACLAGGATARTSIEAALAEAGVEADVRCVAGDQLHDAARRAAGETDVVVAGGGDGTISAVAGALAGGDTPLGVLATGTLNHFAKDLGIPLDLGEAARTIAAGRVRVVDVGRVNGDVFVNNSSLGVYAHALLDRDAARDRWGLGKWPAMALASLITFWRSPMVRVKLVADGRELSRRTPLVFVGNNRYRLDLLRIGERDRLDAGELSLYVANTATRWGMLRLMARAMLGRLEQSRDFESYAVSDLWIDTSHKRRHVAIDGEVAQLKAPFHYQIWPRALQVIVPPATDAPAPPSPTPP
jgi:diacylglycerol kinase family enzyme